MVFGRKDTYKPMPDEENPYPKSNDDKFTQVDSRKINFFPTKKKRFVKEESLAL